MNNRLTVLFMICAALMMTLPSNVLACACCAEPGTYLLRTSRPSSYELDLLKQINFDKTAKLFLTEADFDIIKGLDDVKNESSNPQFIESGGAFDLVNNFTGRLWRFEMRSVGGKKGVLTLPVPTQMVSYKVDTHDEEDRPNGPLLYKEFRFKGSVTGGTGIFRSSMIRPTTYFLVFQGRGNGCDEASNFSHWRLEIEGPQSRYAFYGKLASPEPADNRAAR